MTRRPTAELLERRSLLAIDVTVAQTGFTADPNLIAQSAAGSGDGAGRTFVAWSDRDANTGAGNEVFLRRFDAAGAAGAAVQVNTTTAGLQQDADVATNAVGRTVVVWQSNSAAGDDPRVCARVYDANGVAVTGELDLVSPSSTGAKPAVAIDASGRFVVAWNEADGVYARRFAANGTASAAAFKVSTGLTAGTLPDVAMLADGRFAVAFAYDNASASVSEVAVRTYAADGTASSSAPLTLSTVVSSGRNGSAAIAAAGQRFVVAWLDSTGDDSRVYFRAVSPTQAALSAATQASQDSDGERSEPRVTGDANGNLTVGWTRQEDGAFYSTVDFRAYDATFAPTGNEFSFGDGSSARTLFDVVPTGTGTFRDVSTIGENLNAGVPVGGQFANVIVLDGTAGGDNVVGYDLNATTFRAAVNGVADDYYRSAYAYVRADLGAGNDRWDTIASTMPTTIKGGDGDDRIYTGDGRDSVSGGEGDDYISTAGENDYVIGDRGNDSIYGGDGADTLTGSAGGNRLYGGNGNDRLKGSNGRDFLYGEGNDDRLEGGGGNDYLDGGGNKDRVYGGDGDDYLIGGSSVDRLYGEAGNDSFVGGPGNDYLFGGDGTDRTLVPEAGDILDSIEKSGPT